MPNICYGFFIILLGVLGISRSWYTVHDDRITFTYMLGIAVPRSSVMVNTALQGLSIVVTVTNSALHVDLVQCMQTESMSLN